MRGRDTATAPGPVVAVRILVGVQVAVALVGLAGAVMVGLVAAFGFALHLDMDTDGTAFVLGLGGTLAVLLGTVGALLAAAARLQRGRGSARTALIVLEAALVVGAVLLATVVGRSLDLSAVLPAPAAVLGLSAVGALGALLARPTRVWCGTS